MTSVPPLLLVAVALAGGVGSAVRFTVDGWVRSRTRTRFAWATTVVNTTGSLLLGLLTGLTVAHLVSADLGAVLGAGFLGGYTTFSTASLETVQLVRAGRLAHALLSGVGMLLACVLLAGLGFWVGRSL